MKKKRIIETVGLFQEGGFTLVELVIAMGLFAVGMLGLSLMSAGLVCSNLSARQRAVAARLAENKMEMLENGDYSMAGGSVEKKLDAEGTPGNGIFDREVAVNEKTAPPCKEVAVTVSWQLKGEHRVVLKSILAP
jgi:prepilin-type N-terminal cleavage/methylation domain-containing protein